MLLHNLHRTIVYGTGKIASHFIEAHPEVTIVGVMDRVRMSGAFNNYPIMVWDDIAREDVDSLVIAATYKNYFEIYERIIGPCGARGIHVYSITGQDLEEYFGTNLSRYPAYSDDIVLKHLIDEHDVISFDIFDTLVTRRVIEPTDIFDLVERSLKDQGITLDGFKRLRREAELESGGADIYRIYEIIQDKTGLTDEQRDQYLEEELCIEKENIIPRGGMGEIFQYARKKGKKIVLTSDMYLTEKLMRDVLSNCGIYGYDRLYISCDAGVAKGNGLFEVVKKDNPASSYLHIGDNYSGDYVSARNSGFDAYLVDNIGESIRYSEWSNVEQHIKTICDKYLLGLITSKAFNDPFHRYKHGYADLILAPVVIAYLQLILSLMSTHSYDGVLFTARDGYFSYNYVRKYFGEKCISIPTYYIYSSRILSYRIGTENISDLKITMEKSGLTNIGDAAEKIYGLPNDSGQEEILEKCLEYKDNYKNYLLDMGLNLDGKYLLCELDGHGTSLYYANKLFTQPMDGAYLIRYHSGDELDPESFAVFDFWDEAMDYSSINYCIELIESVLSSREPSVLCVDQEKNPVFSKEHRSFGQIELMEKVQKQLLDIVYPFINKFDEMQEGVSADFAEHCFDAYLRIRNALPEPEFTLYDDLKDGKKV